MIHKIPAHLVERIIQEIAEGVQIGSKGGRLYVNARCPVCGDSKKCKRKKRFHIHENDDWYNVTCYNCGLNTNFQTMIKDFFPEYYDQINLVSHQNVKDYLESNFFQEKKTVNNEYADDHEKADKMIRAFLSKACIPLNIQSETPTYEKLRKYAVKKLKHRLIKQSIIDNMYFCVKGKYIWRVIIPFYNNHGQIYFFQGRDINPVTPSELRYKSCAIKDLEIHNKVYNYYTVNPDKTVYICEGLIDSMFIENSIALCNANIKGELTRHIKRDFPNRVWCLDNPWIDNTGRERTLQLLEQNEKCLVFPSKYKKIKDINDLAIKMKVDIIDRQFINENIFNGIYDVNKYKLVF
jgi:transcription elongation factor Elf1